MAHLRFTILIFLLSLAAPLCSAQDATAPAPAQPMNSSESPEALRDQLEKILHLAKKGKRGELEAAVDQLEIPEAADWFQQTFGLELGPKMAAVYQADWDGFRDSISLHFRSDAERGSAHVKTSELSGSSNAFNSKQSAGILAAMKPPGSLYQACDEWKAEYCEPLPGVYIYVRGAFRVLNWQTLFLLPNVRPLRIRIGGNVAQTQLVSKAPPIYPPEAREKGITGTVRLHVIIGADGAIKTEEVANPTEIDPLLAQSALDAVKQWRYKPTLLNGDPVEVDTTVLVTFELGER